MYWRHRIHKHRLHKNGSFTPRSTLRLRHHVGLWHRRHGHGGQGYRRTCQVVVPAVLRRRGKKLLDARSGRRRRPGPLPRVIVALRRGPEAPREAVLPFYVISLLVGARGDAVRHVPLRRGAAGSALFGAKLFRGGGLRRFMSGRVLSVCVVFGGGGCNGVCGVAAEASRQVAEARRVAEAGQVAETGGVAAALDTHRVAVVCSTWRLRGDRAMSDLSRRRRLVS
mmetsp:Transcript_5062/g.14332  ORF Transcript_5062/g.14332 Transcript_5062/m.14332 type:complete len:225 (-) Transcript_5062:41-715(-)